MARISTELEERLEQLGTLSKAKAFLGREFLTWLWYRIDENEQKFSVKTVDEEATHQVQAWIDDRVVLESTGVESQTQTLKGGDPSSSAEATVALQHGKTVREVKLGFEINGNGPYMVTLGSDGLSANGLSPRALSVPTRDSDEEETLPLSERLDAIDEFMDVLDGLFKEFIDQRTAADWESNKLSQIKGWVKTKRLDQSAAMH